METGDRDSAMEYVPLEDNEGLIQAVETDETSLLKITVFMESFVTLIIAFSVFYFILEVNEVANYNNIGQYNIVNNIVEVIYLFTVFIVLCFRLHRFRWSRNSLVKAEFDNYPMLLALLICTVIVIGYYFLNFVSITIQCLNISRIFATLSELLFVVAVVPFAIVCQWNKVSSGDISMRIKTKVTILLAMCGCLVIFMRKVSLKIEKDIVGNSTVIRQDNCSDVSTRFIHKTISGLEDILELVDITCILIVLIFLINPLRLVSKIQTKERDVNFESLRVYNSIVTSVSLVKFRWPTLVLSTILVAILVSASFVVSEVMDSNLNESFKASCLIFYLSASLASYVIGVIYGTIYYFSEIRTWNRKTVKHTSSDEHFNRLTSTAQIIYAGSMILCLLYLHPYKPYLGLFCVELFNFIFLAIQVLIQAGCIDVASRREMVVNKVTNWKSRLFPPVLLASINFCCLVISIAYSQNPIFIEFLQDYSANKFIYIVIKDLALPITILNRLHGMAFFINLSRKQWHDAVSNT